jgi:hypothetical protein
VRGAILSNDLASDPMGHRLMRINTDGFLFTSNHLCSSVFICVLIFFLLVSKLKGKQRLLSMALGFVCFLFIDPFFPKIDK